MAKKFEEIIADLKKGQYAPIYLLHGEESYFIDQVADYIEKNALAESEKGFNQTILYGKDVDVANVLSQARRFPMMSERQVVIVKEAKDIQDFNKETGQSLMEAYLASPLPSTILVFAYKYKLLDKRTKLAKAFYKHAVVLEAKKMYENQIPDWIQQYVRSQGFGIEDGAVKLLTQNIGTNLERMAHEIDKIMINFKEPQRITEGHVQKFVGISKEFNVFELQKAIAIKDHHKAIQIANYFEANPKSNPILPVITTIFNLFTRILQVHQQKDKSDNNIATVLGVHRFFVGEYLMAARNYALPKVIQNISHIRDADLASKKINTVSTTDGQVLKELIVKLIN